MKKLRFSPKTVLIELLKLTLMLIVVANIVSYLKKPDIVDTTLPHLQMTTIDGNRTDLARYAGKPFILYFWGSWCPICKMSSPVMSDLSRRYQVLAIAVNSGSDADIRHFMREKGLHFPVVNDADGAIAQRFGIDTFPTTFLYNDKGSLIFTDVGYTSAPSIKFKLWIGKFL